MRFVNVTVIDDDRLERRFEAFEVSLSNVQVLAGASIGRYASHPKLGAGMSVCGYASMRVCGRGRYGYTGTGLLYTAIPNRVYGVASQYCNTQYMYSTIPTHTLPQPVMFAP